MRYFWTECRQNVDFSSEKFPVTLTFLKPSIFFFMNLLTLEGNAFLKYLLVPLERKT
jgi:hypothetical protein